MPYSFTQIEREKTNKINVLIGFLIIFYFAIFWVFVVGVRLFFYEWVVVNQRSFEPITVDYFIKLPSIIENVVFLIMAIFTAFFHWSVCSRGLIDKCLKVLRAKPLNVENQSHKQFQNILEELSVATGNVPMQGYVIPSRAVNAFSLTDYEGRNIIGVTQGLLFKLKRPQIEAVLAHEAAHIVSGDSVDAMLVVSLFSLPAEILMDLTDGGDNPAIFISRSIPGFFTMIALSILAFFGRNIGWILNFFISRERDVRADAIAVRLCRNPLSLAEAICIADHNWKGRGLLGSNLKAIFFVNPKHSFFDSSYGLFSNIFSTHTPLGRRLSVLLDMAHMDHLDFLDSLEDEINPQKKDKKKSSWYVKKDREWMGPLSKEDISELSWVRPETLTKQSGAAMVLAAGLDASLKQIVEDKKLDVTPKYYCPKCYVYLKPVPYEGLLILSCHNCGGYLVEKKGIVHILQTREVKFSKEIVEFAELTKEENRKKLLNKKKIQNYTEYEYTCPRCRDYSKKMKRGFYSLPYHVEVDECTVCGYTWFDKYELELLQYLYEKYNPLPPDEGL